MTYHHTRHFPLSFKLPLTLSIPLALATSFCLCLSFTALINPRTAHATPANTITITNESGSAQTNYPYQFGRPFIQGEIPHYPQVLINGVPVLTQADVKNRYPDGSVKFAVISVIVPSIPTAGALTLSFRDQATGNNTPLSQAQMLGANFNFDSTITISTTTGASASASARQMLQDGNYTYWTQGPVATTIILQDSSVARKYDLGFDAYRSIHPVFYATFWPSLNEVSIRAAGENDNTETLEDVHANLVITAGNTSPQTVYTQANVPMLMATDWTKTYWLGGTPSIQINIDNNLPYLIATDYLPNYDTSLTVPQSSIQNEYNAWSSRPHNLYDADLWDKGMPDTGGRQDIAHVPTWDTLWLYTGDWRMREVSLNEADLAGAWPLHSTEGDATKKYDQSQTISALGLPISAYARPSVWLYDDRTAAQSQDEVAPIGDTTCYGNCFRGDTWSPDQAHTPDPFSVPYMLTGDPYYLEQLQQWAAVFLMENRPVLPNDRGTTYYRGDIEGQIRGQAWEFRLRVNAAFLSPDGSPEQSYFTTMVNNAIAIWDGERDITGTSFDGSTFWNLGNTPWSYHPIVFSPLHFWGGTGDEGINAGTTAAGAGFKTGTQVNATAIWMQNYLLFELGAAKEKGFDTEPLIKWLSYNTTSQFNVPGYDPSNIAQYKAPVSDINKVFFPDWATIGSYYATPYTVANFTHSAQDTQNGYANLATAATSMLTNEAGGATAWTWMYNNARVPNMSLYAANPSWAFLPRSITDIPLPPPVVTPPGTGSAPTVTFTGSPTSISSGQSSSLTWSSTNATSCTGSGFAVSGTSGSASVMPASTTTYTITCTGAGGSTSQSVTVTVSTANPTQKPTVTLTASPTSVSTGGSTALTWSSTNATSCTGQGFTASGTGGSVTISPTQTTTYSITCAGAGGSTSASATVTVSSATPGMPTVTLTASPTSITAGQSSTLTWSSTNAEQCSAQGFDAGSASGSVVVSPVQSTTYHITCFNANNSSQYAQDTVTVTVTSSATTPPPSTSGIAVGSPVVINTSMLNIRANPTVNTTIVATEPQNTPATVVAGPTSADGYTWWQITAGRVTGWVVDTYLTLASGTVPPPPPTSNAPTVTFSASPATITAGQSATLTWSSTNATSCTGQGFTAGSPSGAVVVEPAQTTTYSITCTGDNGSATQNATVTISSSPETNPTTTTTPPTTTTSQPSGLTLSRTLYRGLSGDDVQSLQNYLITKGYLAAGNATGYYGPLTESAVQQLQCSLGIVCSGTPSSTGYGVVGPKTTAAIGGTVSDEAPPSGNASSLTPDQISAVISLLRAFGADDSIITQVEASLGGGHS